MSKVKKAVGLTGERNIEKGSRKQRGAEAAAVGTRAVKVVKQRSATKKKTAARQSNGPGAAPMRKAIKSGPITGKRTNKKPAASGVRGKKVRRGGTTKGRLSLVRGRVSKTPVVTVAVKSLDPLRKCGPNTTVQLLYRVDEMVDGRRTAHLVFFDRHGWYCEHGRTCPAVGHAKKHKGQIARVS